MTLAQKIEAINLSNSEKETIRERMFNKDKHPNYLNKDIQSSFLILKITVQFQYTVKFLQRETEYFSDHFL